ncbi:MAG: FAD:protein FMN transferase [Rhodanobacteraceae bacterium]
MAESARRCRPLLGTLVEIEAQSCAIDAGFDAIAQVHASMSFHSQESDLARLRRAACGSRVEVAPATIEVLRIALDLYAATDGLFDVTCANRLVADGFLPIPYGSDLRRMTGTSADIEIDDATHLRCHRALLIDLGGIAKGYAVDCAVTALIEAGAQEGIVNAGGDLRVFGKHSRLVHARGDDGALVAAFEAREVAIASSDNRRSRDDRRGRTPTPHIGHRGQPVVTDECIVVAARRCVIADAFTKIAMADRAMARRLIGRYGGWLPDLVAIERAA